MNLAEFTMRSPCRFCGHAKGSMTESGGQNSVRCLGCSRHVYNAPKSETGEAPRPALSVATRSGLSSETKERIRERDGFRCLMCGRGAHDVILHVGHFLSVSEGLTQGLTPDEINDDCNLMTTCEECNLALGKRSLPPRLLPTLIRVWRGANVGSDAKRQSPGITSVEGERR